VAALDRSIIAGAESDEKGGATISKRLPDIDLGQLEELAHIQCTQEEAAAVLGISQPTLNRRLKQKEYREAWEHGRARGRSSLRRRQWEKNSDTMLIWLGKQILGQRDTPENPGDARSAAEEYLRLQKGE